MDSDYLSQKEKIKIQLLNKFQSKYPFNEIKPFLSIVIDKFVESDEITIPNLKLFDAHIKNEAIKFPEYNLKRRTKSLQIITDGILPAIEKKDHIEKNLDVFSVKSMMSGATQISMLSESKKQKLDMKTIEEQYFKENKSITQPFIPLLSKFSNDSEDEWGSILKFNNLLYKEERKKAIEKEKIFQERYKQDLDMQVQSKKEKQKSEREFNIYFDNLTNKHAEYLKDLERERQEKYKIKCLEDKEMRDCQVKDEKRMKKQKMLLDELNGKLFIKNIIKENNREKSLEMERKKGIRETTLKIMEEEANNKKRKLKLNYQMKLDDRKLSDDYIKILDERDNDRENFFKMLKSNKGGSIDLSQAMNKQKELNNKLIEEEALFGKYAMDAERRY